MKKFVTLWRVEISEIRASGPVGVGIGTCWEVQTVAADTIQQAIRKAHPSRKRRIKLAVTAVSYIGRAKL